MHNILAQFADDRSAYLKYDPLCIYVFVRTLHEVESQLGLKISYEKTTVYRVGSLRNTEAKLYTQNCDLRWSNGPLDTLGVKIDCDSESECVMNFTEIINKFKNVSSNWYNRTLTLFGKILVVNSLMGSLLVYKLTTIMNLSTMQIKKLNNIIREFIWGGKKPKIALETLTKKREQGGARLVDISAKQDTIKIGWIFLIEPDLFLAECAYSTLSKSLGQLIWRCNVKYSDEVKMYKNLFWSSVLASWSKIHYGDPLTKNEILEEIIWLNSNLRIGGTPVI